MKIKKLTGKSVGSAAETVLGVAAGSMLSNGVSEVIPLENKTIAKAIIVGVGVLGASVVSGEDSLSKLARNTCLGMAIQQTKEIVVETAQPILPEATGTGVNKFLHDVFELPASQPAAMASPFAQNYLANPVEQLEAAPASSGFATA